VPQAAYKNLLDSRFDLAINQQSMQEMNQAQVDNYCDLLHKSARRFYSCNISQHSAGVIGRTGIVEGLNARLIRAFPEIIWDSESEAALMTRLLRGHPKLELFRGEMVRMASQVELLQKCHRFVSSEPLRRFSDVKLRRLIFRCR